MTKTETGGDDPGGRGRWRFLRRGEIWFVVGIFLLAAGLRVWHLAEMRANDPFFEHPSTDPKLYHAWAQEIAGGDILGERVFHMGPLYPYFLAGLYSLFGSSLMTARVAQMVLGLLNILIVYFLGRRIFGVRTGVLSALIAAVYSMFIFFEGLLLLATLQVFLNLSLVWALLSARARPTFLRWLGAGALFGLSALARPNVLILGLFLLPWLAYEVRRSGASWRTVAFHAASLCFGIGLAISPATVRNYAVSGDFVLVDGAGGMNFYVGNGPDANGLFVRPRIFVPTEVGNPESMRNTFAQYAEEESGRPLASSEVSAYWRDRALDHIRQDVGRWRRLLMRKLGLFLNEHEIAGNRDYHSSLPFSAVLRLPLPGTGAILPFALLGMVLALPRFRDAFPLYAMVAAYAVALALFFMLARYRTPVLPFFILFAGYCVHRLLGFVRRLDGLAILLAGIGLAISFAVVHLDLGKPGPSDYQIHFKLGIKYQEAGRIPEAVSELRKAVEANPGGLSAHDVLARIYEADPEQRMLAVIHWTALKNLAARQGKQELVTQAERHLRALKR